MKYNILSRETGLDTADGYGIWETVGEWNDVDSPEDAIFFWMDAEQEFVTGFEQTGPESYRFNGVECDVMAIPEDED